MTPRRLSGEAMLKAGAMAVAAAVFMSAPLWADGGTLFLLGVLAIQVVFAVSFNLIFGLTGLVSFGHAAYFAAGAYTTALLLRDLPELPAILALLAGGLVAALVGVVIGFVSLRRTSGIYFAILTLALGELIHLVISKSTLLGREDGFTGIPRPVIDLFLVRIETSSTTVLYFVILCAAVILLLLMAMVWYGSLGRALSALRQDPERAEFLGIDVARLRFVAFVLAAAMAGLAGGLYAPWAQLITPEIARWTYSAIPILFCLLGGASSFWGPMVGGAVFVWIEHTTRNLVGLSELITGAILLAFVLVAPGGLVGAFASLRDRLSRPAGKRSRALSPSSVQ
jgi:branched-chain amino acid transport system permease protein